MAARLNKLPVMPAIPAQVGAELTRLDTGLAIRRVKSPAVEIPISLPLLPRWDELAHWMRQIDRRRAYTNRGPLCVELERRLGRHFLGGHGDHDTVCLTANGTSGLTASLLALDLPPGSFCVMPSWTFIATASAVRAAGLVPYLIDVDLETWAITPAGVEAALRVMPQRPSAVIPVSPFGAPLDHRQWQAFAKDSGIAVVFDAAAAFDSLQLSDIPAVVSMHATKPFGVGEGGFVASTNAKFIRRLRQVTNFGFSDTRIAHNIGINAKLSEYHCAVGLAQLEKWRETRRTWQRLAVAYRHAFGARSDILALPGYGTEWIGSSAVFRFVDRSVCDVATELARSNVESRRWWQRGVAHHPAFADTAATLLPNTERLARETLALPCYLTMRAPVFRSVITAVDAITGTESQAAVFR